MTTVRRAAALAVALGVVLLVAAPASAQDAEPADWVIDRFSADITIDNNGTMRVVEKFAVDFRNSAHHGIYRVVPVLYDLRDEDVNIELPEGRRPGDFLRAIDVTDIAVTSSAPDNLVVNRPSPIGGRDLSLRIGDEDRTVTGPQTYTISYTVTGALNPFESHDELYWNATGNAWEVPISRARVVVTAPAIRQVDCFQGPTGSTQKCQQVQAKKRTATFIARGLEPGAGMTVVVGFPRDAIDVPPPILRDRWNARRALVGSPAAAPAAGAVGGVGLVGLLLLMYRQGRDRVTRGLALGGSDLSGTKAERRGLFSSRVTPVEFRPPDDLRPGQMGVLIDERVDAVDISASIVDLAVRGHLRITEITERKLLRDKKDWQLDRVQSDGPLEPFERRLLKGLFRASAHVLVSDLKGTFAKDYNATQKMLYADAQSKKWFPRQPDKVRAMWLTIGLVLTALGIAGFVAAMIFTTWAVAVLPVIVLGLIVVIGHRWMPHRTPLGSQTLDRVLGFREFIVTAEAGRAEFAEHAGEFVTYLPYAIVFGVVDRWARTFAALNVQSPELGVGTWYVGTHPGGFDAPGFSSGLNDFSSAVGSSLPQAPASSGSSGFSGGSSGGGMGGGGGGGW